MLFHIIWVTEQRASPPHVQISKKFFLLKQQTLSLHFAFSINSLEQEGAQAALRA